MLAVWGRPGASYGYIEQYPNLRLDLLLWESPVEWAPVDWQTSRRYLQSGQVGR